MKKTGTHILLFITLLFSAYSQAAFITWDSTSNNVGESSIFTLDVIVTGFVDIVDGGGIDLSFDPSVLNVLSVSIDTVVWDFTTDTGVIDNVAGTVNGIAVNAFSTVTGDFTVASIEFQALGIAGLNTDLILSEYALNPWASGGSNITPLSFVNANVVVTPVPAAVWLFGSGLIMLLSVARRKHGLKRND